MFFGGRAVSGGLITLGDFVEINARLIQLAWPTISLGFVVASYQRGRASLDRINEILTVKPEIWDGKVQKIGTSVLKADSLSLELSKSAILKDITFTLGPKRMLGIVGPSGSGKSSLVRALAREIPLGGGQLTYSGIDLTNLHLSSWFQEIALVSSEPFLFSASIRDNIKFARPDARDEEVLQVVKAVSLEEDIKNFMDGMETEVGERGITLSGGQRQRLALARALLRKARILILDDSLSAVDADTASRIVENLKHEGFTSSTIVVSHRLSAVREANEILVMERGKIVERGSHKSLLKHGKLYRALWGLEELERKIEMYV